MTSLRRSAFSDAEIVGAIVAPRSAGELAKQFGVSRQAMFLRLDRLRRAGRVEMTGDGRGARWTATTDVEFEWPLDAGIDEDTMWREFSEAWLAAHRTSDNAGRILRYAVTEMLNNALDHSSGSVVRLSARRDGDTLEVVIDDDGIGVWNSLVGHFALADPREAIAHLAKGQQTTFPERHSGQGIFFTSKAVDRFELDSEANRWTVDAARDDMSVGPGSGLRGTRVRLVLGTRATRTLKSVFDEFSEPGEPGIDRTTLKVRLSDRANAFVSRSEAKKLTAGLDDFSQVVLDFDGVVEVGQGFVDELFRVWARDHPQIELVPVNMNEDVTFMIRRGLTR